jgi:hypothetical protein
MSIVPVFALNATTTPLHVRGSLNLLGWKSMRQWATAMGYQPSHVHYALRALGHKKPIYGRISLSILQDLDKTLAVGITPESLAGEITS